MDLAYMEVVPLPGGGKVSSVRDDEAIVTVNGTFFIPSTYVPIGIVVSWGIKQKSYPGPKRWYLIQREKLTLSEDPPKDWAKCILVIQSAPMLVHKGHVVVSTKGLCRRSWEILTRRCERTIIAIDGYNNILVYRSFGDLPTIAKCLQAQGVMEAINLDGGRSTKSGVKVGNAIKVCWKSSISYLVWDYALEHEIQRLDSIVVKEREVGYIPVWPPASPPEPPWTFLR